MPVIVTFYDESGHSLSSPLGPLAAESLAMDAKLIVVGGESVAAEYALSLPAVIGRSRSASIKVQSSVRPLQSSSNGVAQLSIFPGLRSGERSHPPTSPALRVQVSPSVER